MVGQFLFWLQECKKQVFVVATANDVSKLPSELLRRGRFDELFFVDLPIASERKEIITMYVKKYLNIHLSDELINNIVNITEGFTGADLESTIRDIAYRHIVIGADAITENSIISSFNNVVPLSQTSPERIDAIRTWGKERAVPASGLPIGEQEIKKKAEIKGRRVLV
jgi:SpoVK/Ycf46/Vps4 family AAA+-type ATPase